MKKAATPATDENTAPVASVPHQDEFTGNGGSYIVDPATGLRTPAPPEPPTLPAE